jgi:predicted nucleotidyltransferase
MKIGLDESEIKQINKILGKFSEIDSAILFGSRAMNTNQPGSDVDIALKGKINFDILAKIKGELEESSLPYFFDVVDYNSISNPDFKKHIDIRGRIIYQNLTNKSPIFKG